LAHDPDFASTAAVERNGTQPRQRRKRQLPGDVLTFFAGIVTIRDMQIQLPYRRHIKREGLRHAAGLVFWIQSLLTCSLVANPITESTVFPLLVGEWDGTGELTNPSDGSITTVTETWKGEFGETGTFLMSGKRSFNDLEHEFAWEYYANQDTIEGQMKVSDPALDVRFETQVNDAALSITLTVGLSGGGGTMTIINTISEDGKTIVGTVEIVNPSGTVTTKGTVTHHKR
jgi:hypothetical protein